MVRGVLAGGYHREVSRCCPCSSSLLFPRCKQPPRLIPSPKGNFQPLAAPSPSDTTCSHPLNQRAQTFAGRLEHLKQSPGSKHCSPYEPEGSDACQPAGASQAEPQLQTLLTLCLPPASFGDQFGGQAKCPIPSPKVFGVPGLPTALCVPAGRLLCLMQVIVVEQSIPPALLLAARTTLRPPLVPSSIALTTESATAGLRQLQRSAPYRC